MHQILFRAADLLGDLTVLADLLAGFKGRKGRGGKRKGGEGNEGNGKGGNVQFHHP